MHRKAEEEAIAELWATTKTRRGAAYAQQGHDLSEAIWAHGVA